MADVSYSVEVAFFSKGSINAPAMKEFSNIDKRMSTMSKGLDALSGAAHGVNSVLDSVGGAVASALSAAATGVGTIVAGGFAMAVKEVFHFNAELENTQISLANLANASGTTANLSGAMRLAGDVVKQMRVDARELPGEFKDLQNIMGLIESATSNAGMGMFGTEKMASQIMVAAAQLKVPFQVAGREMSMMLSGNARHSMPLFTKLGFTDAKAFNKLSQEDRVSAVNEKLGKLNTPEALGVIKNTWEVIRSTAVDSVRQATAAIGGPLFERVKDVVKMFNGLGGDDKLKNQYIDFATKLGGDLVKAFDYGVAGIQHWYGPVSTFLGTMERGLARVGGGFAPVMHHMLDRLERFMNDPAAFSKIEHLVSTLIALRVASGAMEGGGSLLSSLISAAPGLKAMGLPMAEVAGALPYFAAALGLGVIAAGGFASALTDSSSALHETAVTQALTVAAASGRLTSELSTTADGLKPLAELFGVAVVGAVEHVVGTLADLAHIVNVVGGALQSWTNFLGGGATLNKTPLGGPDYPYSPNPWEYGGSVKSFNAPPEPGDLGKKVPVHNTTIHRVEIHVNSNQDPNRIAKRTADILMDIQRHPKIAQLSGAPVLSR